ncbi:putative diguanylate cyclase YedQ [bacterium HR39]|nr:putative diguanylate cyclase YedQ [bacterium HR39]
MPLAADVAHADLLRALENERTLNALLRVAVRNEPLDVLLEECLDVLLSVSWLSVLPKGGIFLADSERGELRLAAHRNLPPPLLGSCARVPFGHCLCGRAALAGQILHAACVDHRHEVRYAGMQPHGHYNVPIRDGERVLGVIVLYLPEGHPADPRELAFLGAVADILALVIRHRRTVEELERVCAELAVAATTDPLTGLFNRRAFVARLAEAWAEAERLGHPLALVLLDLDRFKEINDTFGHEAGDRVLQHTARLLRARARRYDVPARIGGEEFALLLPGAGRAQGVRAAERLRADLEGTPVDIDSAGVRVTASFGVAAHPTAEDPQELMRRADRALYAAKRAGRNRVEAA